jgi:polyisoprenoid-binding protein YceI
MATWILDPGHTLATFSARHMMITTVRGQFAPPVGKVEFDPAAPALSSVEAEIDAATLSSGLADRDAHLKSPDFLDVANYPKITFRSTQVEVTGENTAKVTGDLTMRGTTRPVTLDVEMLGIVNDPWGGRRVGFTASGKINREDWGLTWNVVIEAGGVLVGKEIRLEIEAEAILQAENTPA